MTSVIPTPYFLKQFKKLYKKYPSLKAGLLKLQRELENNPELGVGVGKNCYKIRLRIKSKNTGKSGGARVITYVKIVTDIVYLISIYDKSEKGDISDSDLAYALNFIDIK